MSASNENGSNYRKTFSTERERLSKLLSNSDIERRIAEAARQRARIKGDAGQGGDGQAPSGTGRQDRTAAHEGGTSASLGYRRDFVGTPVKHSQWERDGRRQPLGHEKRIQEARAERKQALAERSPKNRDHTPLWLGTSAAAPAEPPAPAAPEAEVPVPADGISSQTQPQPSEPRLATPAAPRDGAEQSPARAGFRISLGRFAAGLAMGSAACMALAVALKLWIAEPAAHWRDFSVAPAVATDLAALQRATGTNGMDAGSGLVPGVESSVAGEIVARAAADPLSSPSVLDGVPSLDLDRSGTPFADLMADANLPGTRGPLPTGDLFRSSVTQVASADLPSTSQAPALATFAADPAPDIETAAARPDAQMAAVGVPQLSTDPSTDPGTAVASIGQSVLPTTPPQTPPPSIAGADARPVITMSRGLATGALAQIREPGPMEPEAPQPPAMTFTDLDQPVHLSALEQLPVAILGSDPAIDLEQRRTELPRAMVSIASGTAVPDGSTFDGFLTPARSDPWQRPEKTAALDLAPAEAAFRTDAAQTPATPQRTMRVIFTVSSEAEMERAALDELDFEVVELQITPFAVPITRVHYFHAEDAEQASGVAATLDGVAVDLTGLIPSPPRGVLEIQLAD